MSFKVRYRGEYFFNGIPAKIQTDLMIDGFPHTFHTYQRFDSQNADGSYNYQTDEFKRIKEFFEDEDLWDIIEVPDILGQTNDEGLTSLECPYCMMVLHSSKMHLLKAHIVKVHKDKLNDFSRRELRLVKA